MVIAFSNFVAPSPSVNVNGERRPIFNDIPFTVDGTNSRLGGPQSNYRLFWQQFKSSPELVATLSVPITDVLGDRPIFTNVDGTPAGRNKQLRAQKFWRDNRMKESTKAGLYDGFVTGDGYWWLGRMTSDERLKHVSDLVKRIGNFLNTKEQNKLILKASQDEDLKAPKKFDYVASATMAIRHTNTEILGYTQNVGGQFAKFNVEEIIHYRYLTLDGKVNGFAPAEALSSEIWLLWYIKQNMVSFFRNGGAPSKMFVLPDEISGSPNHKFLVQTLQRYQMVQNRNGNLVFTGNVDMNDLAANPKDMEYKELALYAASNIAFAYGIPVTRIPYLVGTSANKGDSGGLAESGYWNRISEIQDEVEDLLNGQLFEEMGVHIHFNRKYKQDEVRESQTSNMNADTITKYQSIFNSKGKKLSAKFMSEFLNIPLDEIEEMTEEDKQSMMTNNGLMGQNQLDKNTVEKEPDNLKRADNKRNVANNSENKGLSV